MNKTFLILFLLAVCIFVQAEQPAEQGTKIHIYGDILEGFPDGTRVLKGNLRAFHGVQKLTAGWGKFREKDGQVEAFSKVKLTDPSYVLTCGHMTAYFNEEKGVARQKPVVTETVPMIKDQNGKEVPSKERYFKLKAREIKTYFNEDRITAHTRVEINEVYFPQFIKPGMRKETSALNCDFMEILVNENRSKGKGNVVLKAPDKTVLSDNAEYYHDEEKVIFTGNARALTDAGSGEKNTVHADQIIFFVKTDRTLFINAKADVHHISKETKEVQSGPGPSIIKPGIK